MAAIITSHAGGVNLPRAIMAGCAAGPRFIQVHPKLLALRADDLASYVLLCERAITGHYPGGVPLSGNDLARYFEADDSPAAATRYTRVLKRLVDQGLARRHGQMGHKSRYVPCWPGTQRRAPLPVCEPYPHRSFVPVYLALFEQYVGTLHPADRGPARVERFLEAPALDPGMLHGWAAARWAAYKDLPRPDLDPEVADRLQALGLLDGTAVYDPADDMDALLLSLDGGAAAPGIGLTPAGRARLGTNLTAQPPSLRGKGENSSPPQPGDGLGERSVALGERFERMLEQMRLLQAQMAEVQHLLAGDSPAPIAIPSGDQEPDMPSQGAESVDGPGWNSVNTEHESNTEIPNTNQTPTYQHHHPHRSPTVVGGGGTPEVQSEDPTEAEELLLREGVIPINARKFAARRPEQVRAAIAYVKKARRPFKDGAAMIVWLLDQNQFAGADERPKCWYCGQPGCTRCAEEQEARLLAQWGDPASLSPGATDLTPPPPSLVGKGANGAPLLAGEAGALWAREGSAESEAVAEVEEVPSSSLLAGAAGQPPLLQALLRCASIEPDADAPVEAPSVRVRATSTFIAERLRGYPDAVAAAVAAALGHPARVEIRGPEPQPAAGRTGRGAGPHDFWR